MGTNQALESCHWTSDREALDGMEDLTVGALKIVQFGIGELPAPYLDSVHGISLGHYYWKRPCQPYAALVNLRFLLLLLYKPT